MTVRTLHHYDRTGLLSPSGRSGAGYRLYSDADLARLQRLAEVAWQAIEVARAASIAARHMATEDGVGAVLKALI